jgi:predicted MFS family arabinose efflux permease
MLSPLVLATMTSQSLLVVLAPTIVAIAADLGAPVATVGQARSVTALVSVVASVALTANADRLPVRALLRWGALLALAACAAVAVATSTSAFLLAHVLVGLAFAPLLSGGFAGLAAFPPERRAWATGYVAGANALAWIVVNPLAAALTSSLSWRAALATPAAVALAALAASGAAAPVPVGPGATNLWEPLRVVPARRWIGSEITAFAAWTCLLTFAGAYFIEVVGVAQSAVGWVLAAGATAYLLASSRAGRLARRLPQRRLVWTSALAMAGVIPLLLGLVRAPLPAVATFCLVALVAGVRTPASAGLALEQLPEHPAAMASARTAATQSGYLVGAVVGGAVIAGPGYRALGVVLAVIMATSAWLVHRVNDVARRS